MVTLFARYGGEEFVIFLPSTDKDGATVTAEKMRDNIEKNSHVKVDADKTERVTITAGVASYPKDGKTVEEIISIADKYLYLGKKTGRNRVVNMVLEDKAQEQSGKRLTKRYAVALKSVEGTNLPRFLEIKLNNKDWKMCSIKDISKNGLKGEIEHITKTGDVFTCRAVQDSDVSVLETFTIQITYTGGNRKNRCYFGAEIIDNHKIWQKLFTLITH